jgi:hypothetical protein
MHLISDVSMKFILFYLFEAFSADPTLEDFYGS